MTSSRRPWGSTRRITVNYPEAIVVRGNEVGGGDGRGKSEEKAFGGSFSILWR